MKTVYYWKNICKCIFILFFVAVLLGSIISFIADMANIPRIPMLIVSGILGGYWGWIWSGFSMQRWKCFDVIADE